jgi:RimJ/RimL family protein N-acetyltransferase
MCTEKGPNIKLVRLTETDLPILFRWINDEELVSFSAVYKPVSWEEHLAWFEKVKVQKEVSIFGIRLNDTDQLIGSCQLRSIQSVANSAELRIRIGESFAQSKGYGSEAVRLLVNFGFANLKLDRVYLYVFTDNERAVKAYMKNGFIKEGILKGAWVIQGKPKDLLSMAILKP